MDLGGGGARTMVEAHVIDEGSGSGPARAKIFDRSSRPRTTGSAWARHLPPDLSSTAGPFT